VLETRRYRSLANDLARIDSVTEGGGDSLRIDDILGKLQLSQVGLMLTRSEAEELQGALESLLNAHEPWHEHVSSDDYQTELTIWIAPDTD
jgi:hypothetical protein